MQPDAKETRRAPTLDQPTPAAQAETCWVVWATEPDVPVTVPKVRRGETVNTVALSLLLFGYLSFAASLFLPVLTTGDAWAMTTRRQGLMGADLFFSGRVQSIVFWVINAPLMASLPCYVRLRQRRSEAGHPLLLCLMILHWIGFIAGVLLMPLAVVLAVLAQMTWGFGAAVLAWIIAMLCVGVGLSFLSLPRKPRPGVDVT